MISKRIHILQWLPHYTKMDAIADCIAGITVGLTLMPQSIAYAALANLTPEYGLYSAFMGSFVYVILGTIKEVSIGPTSLMALLTISYTEFLPVDFVILLAFLAGCVELTMGLLKLGFIVDFISVPVTSGFTSATSIIIITTQLKNIFGIKFSSKGIFNYFQEFFKHINEINVGDTILGVSCIIFLLILRRFNYLQPKNKKLKKLFWLISICRNALIVLIASSVAFYFHNKDGKVPFKIAGPVPQGIPQFRLPNFTTTIDNKAMYFTDMMQELGSAVILIPLTAVLSNVAIAKAFAGASIDATQEMIALGMGNIMGSFVQAMPTCGAFTRSAVSNASGVRTPLSGVYAGTIILLALTFLTPYFYFVPKSTLAAVLISAVMFMIDYEIIPQLWRCSKFDLLLTVATFFGSLIYGVEIGMLIGVALNIISLLKLWTRPKIETQICCEGKENNYILIKPEIGLLFPGVDYLTQEVIRATTSANNNKIPVVLDFSNVLRVDFTAVKSLKNLLDVFHKKHQQLLFANVRDDVYNTLKTVVDLKAMNLYFDCDNYNISDEKIRLENDSEMPLLSNSGNTRNSKTFYTNESN